MEVVTIKELNEMDVNELLEVITKNNLVITINDGFVSSVDRKEK